MSSPNHHATAAVVALPHCPNCDTHQDSTSGPRPWAEHPLLLKPQVGNCCCRC